MNSGQFLSQRQSLQQRLSPQQIQYIKLLQLPSMALEMRVKDEIEQNPLLEDLSEEAFSDAGDFSETSAITDTATGEDSSAGKDDIDWDSILPNQEYEGRHQNAATLQEWIDIPKPYQTSLLEELEQQVDLLNLTDKEQVIAEQIIGSLDEDGYLRRDLVAIADSIAFNSGLFTSRDEVELVLLRIQRLEPPGIGARDLRECLHIQLDLLNATYPGRTDAIRIVRDEWELFEKKHFDRLMKRLDLNADTLKVAYDCIQHLDPRPGVMQASETAAMSYVIPDFSVRYVPSDSDDSAGDFQIILNRKNAPTLRISPSYKLMWEELQQKNTKTPDSVETQSFIKTKMESARAFIEALQQRQHTLMNVMRTIVALQETFFREGTTLKPMILKDIADRVQMDISTISRVVNGKFVQTPFGVYELKYFFNEGVETSDGEMASNRDVKLLIAEMITNEDKHKPLSDDAIAVELKVRGFLVARRTVSKYREQLDLPVARLRKSV